MFFYQQKFAPRGDGGSLGFSFLLQAVPGYGIEFDGWRNIGGGQPSTPKEAADPLDSHIALIKDWCGNHLTYVTDPRVKDNQWHDVCLSVDESSLLVYLDCSLILQWEDTFDRSYDGFGFCRATGGGGSDWHLIDNVSVSAAFLEPHPSTPLTPAPSLTVPPSVPPNPNGTNLPSTTPLPTLPSNITINPYEIFSDNFSTDSGAWQYLGSAYRDMANQNLVLTISRNDQTGVPFFRVPIQGAFMANFSYKAVGDGFAMFFYKQKYPSTLNWEESYGANGVAGSRLGFNSGSIIPGYGIEFDGWANIEYEFANIVGGQPNPAADPSSGHIALIKDFTGDHLAYVNNQRIYDDMWHQVSVQAQGSFVTVYFDQERVLQWSGSLNRTYDGFGFCGSNGQVEASQHLIDNFLITTHNLQQPTLTTSGESSVSESSFKVKIHGNLTYNGTGISNAPTLLSYSATEGRNWQDLTTVTTGPDFSYSALWLPSVTGSYLLKSTYEGNQTLLGVTDIVNLAMEPCAEQNVFSLSSNSTLSELTFNSTSKELSFIVSGEAGTTGYVNIYIPKTLIADISGLTVYLDNNQTDYNAESQGDNWLLYFTYHHSNHLVTINLCTPPSPTPLP